MSSAVPSPAPAVKLTPRGRRCVRLLRTVAIIIGGLAIGFVIALSFGAQAAAGTSHDAPIGSADYSVVVVEEGQSLWSIAAAVSGDADTRDVVLDIAEVNSLDAHVVHPGQELAIPAR